MRQWQQFNLRKSTNNLLTQLVFEDAISNLGNSIAEEASNLGNSIDEEASNVKEVIDNSVDAIETAIENTLGTESLHL